MFFILSAQLISRSRVELEQSNIPAIDPSKRYLFVSNHQSYGDVFAIFLGWPVKNLWRTAPVRFMTSPNIYYSLLYPIIVTGGGFPTRRLSRQPYSAVEQAISFLRAGQNVVIFPEGRRTHAGVTPAHSGVYRIIQGCDFPIEIVLVHLDWQGSGLKRSLRTTYADPKTFFSAQDLLDQIYTL